MEHSLEQIRRLRKKHNISQKELANLAGVSQSLIAKVETGNLDPTFTKANQIFSALENLREKEEIKVKEVMNKKLLYVGENETISNIITIMRKKGISQIPVIEKELVRGLVTEKIILQAMTDYPEKLSMLKVNDIMEDAPPVVSINSGFKVVLELLKENSIVLVSDKGEIKGVVSKSDLLGVIY